jgi:pimeloyl-ACP methyl ester carboxylesterase
MRKLVPLSLLSFLVLTAACTDLEPLPPAPGSPVATSSIAVTAGGVRRVEGVVGPGARYALYMPENWNGDLVLYAHGYRDPGPVDLRDQDNLGAIRERLNAAGYAVGYSSFAENGFAVKDGMQRTSQLRGIFVSHFQPPRRTMLMGHSLGGLVALGLAEQFPTHYDGALVMCGITGGSQATVDYIAHIRVLFDFFYPGVLPGHLLELPAGTGAEDVQNRAIAAMTATLPGGSPASLQGAIAIAALMEELGKPVPFIGSAGPDVHVQTLVGSIVYALSFHARGFADLMERTNGGSPFDNSATRYASPVLPDALVTAVNAGVQRYTTTPGAAAYLQRHYEPTGALQKRVVTLNNGFDPIAASFHGKRLRERVEDRGRGHLLVERRTLNPFAYGHCAISVDETIAAFEELAAHAGD